MIDLQIFKKIQFTFSPVFLIRMIGRIIVESEFKMNFSVKMLVTIATAHTHKKIVLILKFRQN